MNSKSIDITPSEQELEQRLSHFTIERASDAIFWVDSEGCFHRVNEAACRLHGYSKEEFLSLHVYDINLDYGRDEWPAFWSKVKEQQAFCLEGRHRTKDGRIFPVERTVNFIVFGGREYTCSFIRDITSRKRAEEALQKSHEALQHALREVQDLKNRLQAENTYLQEEIKVNHNFDDIISKSAVLQKVLRELEQVAATDSTVLITGETGTGKELLARAIHSISNRRDRPLVKVNCAALPANLIESELFGHEKGAFTGAMTRRLGRFELAHSGTIFLDEIGDLPRELQAKLLRVLQEGEFERVGGSQTLTVDVRVIAATNRDLEKGVSNESFREDLYYRLNVFPVKSPPLRDRKEDIPLLVHHFTRKFSAKMGKSIVTIPQRVMETLQAYHWPGNVRELENMIERAVILSNGVTLEPGNWLPKSSSPHATESLLSLAELEKNHILETLDKTNWVVSGPAGAAKLLGLKPTTLEAKMKKLGVRRAATVFPL